MCARSFNLLAFAHCLRCTACTNLTPVSQITTDCGAVIDMRGSPAHGSSDAVVAAWALNNGTDIEMGSMCMLNGLLNATHSGLTTEAAITRAARRTLLLSSSVFFE